MSKEIIATQNRVEELLLDLIYNKVIAGAPTKPDELDEPASDWYKGHYDGWWDCLESLRIASSGHTESNEYRLQRYAR